MRNIKHHRLLVRNFVEYAEGLSVKREEGLKELWVVVRRNPAFKDLRALFEKVFLLTSDFGPSC